MSRETSVFRIDAAAELPRAAGGKALGLRSIARAGLPFPPAFAVLPRCSESDLSQLAAALKSLGASRAAVRSSAADEDGAQHSFAGILETQLGVPLERLAEAVAAVASSADSERARAYRRQRGLAPPSGPCGVVVQAMVDAEWAGVAFSRGGGVLIEAVEGLGEAAVNGEAAPSPSSSRARAKAFGSSGGSRAVSRPRCGSPRTASSEARSRPAWPSSPRAPRWPSPPASAPSSGRRGRRSTWSGRSAKAGSTSSRPARKSPSCASWPARWRKLRPTRSATAD
jgi:hypothetical protein